MLKKYKLDLILMITLVVLLLMALYKGMNYLKSLSSTQPSPTTAVTPNAPTANAMGEVALAVNQPLSYQGQAINSLAQLSKVVAADKKAAIEAANTPAQPVTPYDAFQLHPFEISHQSRHHEWTQGEGKSHEAMRALAHTEAEFERLRQENAWVERRQLVYRKQTIGALQKAIKAGKKLPALVLPGFDGEEMTVTITHSEDIPEQKALLLSGHLQGQPEVSVSMAYVDGVESVLVIPQNAPYYLELEPREPGQVVVKKIIMKDLPPLLDEEVYH